MLSMMSRLLSVTVLQGSEEPYELLLPLALILFLSKGLSLGFKKIKVPEVVGYLVGGLLLGCIFFIPNQTVLTGYTMDGINDLAKIGVVLILFTAGLETDLKKIKAVGFASIVITILGVVVPMCLGFLLAWAFKAGDNVYSWIYYGVILSATSVSITVAALKELGKLDTNVGSAIVSAAILDDVIGIILLSLVISLAGGDSGTTYVENKGLNLFIIILVMIGFFAFSFLIGQVIIRFFNWMGKKWPHHVRIPIFSLAFCFLWAYLAEKVFQIADITGGYVAGLILSATSSEQYIDTRTDGAARLMFTPIFFASVALKMFTADLNFQDTKFLIFGLCWVLVGAIGKIIGAGGGALLCKFKFKDSLRVGIGMMARAEVLIVCAQKGVDTVINSTTGETLVSSEIIPFTLILILITSFMTPILLKITYKDELDADRESGIRASGREIPQPMPQDVKPLSAESQDKTAEKR